MIVKVVNNSDNALPQYETGGSAGLDVRSAENGLLKPGQFKLITTGLRVEIPYGYEMQVRPRSGLAKNYGITVLNSPGTIDADYRGEIGVILINHGQYDFEIVAGDRIAQLVLCPVEKVQWLATDTLDTSTKRGEKGFGSTGK
jgi:dUTP pyrophosphatase